MQLSDFLSTPYIPSIRRKWFSIFQDYLKNPNKKEDPIIPLSQPQVETRCSELLSYLVKTNPCGYGENEVRSKPLDVLEIVV